MCDYSLQNVRSRPAAVGDNLITRNFGTGTRGFAAAEDLNMAVCLMPGTEIAFPESIALRTSSYDDVPKSARRTYSIPSSIFALTDGT